jgi:Protein of unknown function (DUF3592)
MGKHGHRSACVERWFWLFAAVLCYAVAAFAAYTDLRWSLARSWAAVPAVIVSSSVEAVPGDTPHGFRVRYRYTWAGKLYEGRTYQQSGSDSFDIAEAGRLARAFPVGSRRSCYVNPGDPSEAHLEHANLWDPAGIGVVMLLIGTAILLEVQKAKAKLQGETSILTDRREKAMLGAFLAGLGLWSCLYFFAPPLSRGLRSLGWRPIHCVVQSGQVRSIPGMWYTTYWPDVVYRYEVDGITYRSNTINASDVGSPWYYGARGTVRRYPTGTATTCFVNPSDPSEAVLVRTLSATQWFGVWPVMIIVMGALLIGWSITGRVIKVGTPRFWRPPFLGAITTSALAIFWMTGADLLRDHRDGLADGLEWTAVVIAGMFATGLMLLWILLAANHRTRGGSVTTPSEVWDPELDRRPDRKGWKTRLANKSTRSPGEAADRE